MLHFFGMPCQRTHALLHFFGKESLLAAFLPKNSRIAAFFRQNPGLNGASAENLTHCCTFSSAAVRNVEHCGKRRHSNESAEGAGPTSVRQKSPPAFLPQELLSSFRCKQIPDVPAQHRPGDRFCSPKWLAGRSSDTVEKTWRCAGGWTDSGG